MSARSENKVTRKEVTKLLHEEMRDLSSKAMPLHLIRFIYDMFFALIGDAMVRGDKVVLSEFGTFLPLRIKMQKGCYKSTITKGRSRYIDQNGNPVTFTRKDVFVPATSLINRMNARKVNVFGRYCSDTNSGDSTVLQSEMVEGFQCTDKSGFS